MLPIIRTASRVHIVRHKSISLGLVSMTSCQSLSFSLLLVFLLPYRIYGEIKLCKRLLFWCESFNHKLTVFSNKDASVPVYTRSIHATSLSLLLKRWLAWNKQLRRYALCRLYCLLYKLGLTDRNKSLATIVRSLAANIYSWHVIMLLALHSFALITFNGWLRNVV